MSIPNILSVLRLILIPVFVLCYVFFGEDYPALCAMILVVSGLTDVADGYIARHYNMITQLGKFLDPLADKLTMFTVCVTLAFKYRIMIVIASIMFIKELFMLIGGIIIMRSGKKIGSSKWYGKMATCVLYAVMFSLIFGNYIPTAVQLLLVIVASAVMLFAFFMYVYTFIIDKKDE